MVVGLCWCSISLYIAIEAATTASSDSFKESKSNDADNMRAGARTRFANSYTFVDIKSISRQVLG